MKVILVHDFLDETGGAEQIVHATKQLLEEEGHSALLYAPATAGSGAGALFSVHHYRSLLRQIRLFGPDIVHVHGMYRNVSASVLLAARRMGVPVAMTLHDFQIVCPRTSLVDGQRRACETGFGFRCFYSNCPPYHGWNRAYQGLKAVKLGLHRAIMRRTVNHFFSPSVCLMQWAVNNFGAKNISLLPNFTHDADAPVPGLPQEQTILFVGKLVEQKGVDLLLEAMDRVREALPAARLKIVGDGPEEQRLRKRCADLRLDHHVAFAGKMPHQQVLREYDRALVVVIPSRYAENCSMVGIEALSRGRVIIASRIGGLPDLVTENESGFLVQPDAVEDLSTTMISALQNTARLERMSARARTLYEQRFSRSAYLSALLSAYDRILHETRYRNSQF